MGSKCACYASASEKVNDLKLCTLTHRSRTERQEARVVEGQTGLKGGSEDPRPYVASASLDHVVGLCGLRGVEASS